MLFHSAHLDATQKRSDLEFWGALAKLPDGLGWPAAALAKDKWSSDKVRGGICKGVPVTWLGLLVQQHEPFSAMDQHLRKWRSENADELKELT